MNKKYNLTLAADERLSGAFKTAGNASNKLSGQLKKQQDELRGLQRAQRDISALSVQRRELKKLGVDLIAAKTKTEKFAREINKSGVATRKQQRDFQQAKRASDALSNAYDKQRDASHSLSTRLRSAGFNTGKLEQEQRRLRITAGKTSKALDTQRASLQRLNKTQAAVSRADAKVGRAQGKAGEAALTVAALAVPIARGVARQSSMADIAKVVNFDGADDRKSFRTQVERLGVESGGGFANTADIAAAAGQSGIAKGEIIDFTRSAGKMAVAFDMEARAAGKTMASWRAAMALNQQQAVKLADAVNHVSNNMNAEAKDIAGVLKRQGATAMASGLSAEQSASLAGALLSSGATEEIASTSMKNLLGALTKGEFAPKAQQDALGRLGFDANMLSGDMQDDAVGTIKSVFKALSEAPQQDQSGLVGQIFGEDSKGSIMPLLKNLKNLSGAFKLTDKSTKFAGSMQAEYSQRLNTAGHKFVRVAQSFDRLLMVVGGSLLPVLEPMAEGLTFMASGLADFASNHETFTSAMTLGVAALVAYKVGSVAVMYARAKLNQVQARGQLSQAKLAAAESQTAINANRASVALARLNSTLAMTGAGGVGAGGRGRRGRSGSTPGGAARGGRFARMAAPLGSTLSFLPFMGGGGDVAKPGASTAAKASKMGKLARLGGPVGAVLATGLALAPLMAGEYKDGKETGSAIGGAAGGLGGFAAGAALGTLLLPGIGTIVGGLVGGYFGGEFGDALGGFAGGLFDDDPDGVLSKESYASAGASKKEISFNSTINLENLPAGVSASQVADEAIRKQREQLLPLLSGVDIAIDDDMRVQG